MALALLQQATARLYEQGPGSLTPELHWVRAGRDEQGRLVVGASPAFISEVLGMNE